MSRWTWARASCRGTSHVRQGTRKQDAFSCVVAKLSTLIVVVSDGAGSASHGGEGASVAARHIARHAAEYVNRTGSLPHDSEIWFWTDEVRDLLAVASTRRGTDRKNFAATLVGIISTGDQTIVFHIGDGAAVARNKDTKKWETLSWPEQGEYASTTFFITDEPSVRLRIEKREMGVDAVAVFSDGIERLALSFSQGTPHAPFFEAMIKPLDESSAIGCDLVLSRKLHSYLDSSAVNDRTDDDKTLILAVLK
ncbi:PP2C family serine/threonine-protein phosphatase [Aestuariivirga sp.]|uniref:PP2C family serine/threonine-protein phosphatase n=1 Tax=Aestuariivirga sp. TaxID=2650926 RepID=UPI0039E4E6DD